MSRQPASGNRPLRILAAGGALAAAIGGAVVTPAATAQAPRETVLGKVIRGVGIEPDLGKPLPLDFEFVDAGGNTVRLDDFFTGRPVILQLVYYDCPMLCKLSSDGLFRSLSNLSLQPGEDFTIVTVSFDPREGPELSARARVVAAERLGHDTVERGWHFLTGQESNIDALCDAVGFRYTYDEATGQYAHAAGLFVLTPTGTLSHFLTGIEYLPRDLRLAIVEASGGKVGSVADQVLLMCYMYDPTTGKYGLAIMTAMRVAGVLTVVTIVAAIAGMLRRERSRRSATDLDIERSASGEPSDPRLSDPHHPPSNIEHSTSSI